jgi:uncharacterized SAM-binding protein YcdF (DUF218 family)
LNLKRLLTILTRLLLIVIAVELAVCIALVGMIHFYGQTDYAQPADAIVVLGAGLRGDGRAGAALTRRSIHAANLWAQGYAPVVICTGGVTMGRPRSEAAACREVLIANGVDSDAIVLEERSRSTEENALFAHDILDANTWSRVVLVSDAYHMLRAQWIFSLEGISVVTSPTVNPPVGIYIFSVAREVAALHWQAIKEILQLPVTYLPTL